ncbi:YbjN domain-containing protein [Qipengyuania sphaerica]|uniref:YbjN domain-containing protein n=1 Tax=Qipengyuania sphaerica TaxID=2867243 RepID=UPI001C877E38|nr:YbjN domain-containing protein [Qipengyuania sphaerica]MBX7540583.1 YbjN domain-containing protein [Qipengyuania sphaerica]
MMKKFALASAIAAASLTYAAPAAAKNVTADVEQIAKIIREEGLQAKIEDSDGEKYIVSGLSGYNFVIRFFGCEEKMKDCKFIQFRAAFSPDNKPTVADVNQFSADNFFARFYVDDESDPVIEMDLDLEQGGMSRALFVDNIAYWNTVLGKYGEFAFSKDK